VSDGPLWIWVVYDHPRDHPDHYVARAQRILTDGSLEVSGTAFSSPNLEDIRAYMEAKGLVRMERHDEDDPVILETWI
jgi:hypothetical protein